MGLGIRYHLYFFLVWVNYSFKFRVQKYEP